ncbi:hypothetical protein ABPG72_019518 [Tetrahymena utriculariae]
MANSINWNGFTITPIIATIPIYRLGENKYQIRIDSINQIFIGNSKYFLKILLFSQSDYLKGYQQKFLEDLAIQHIQNCFKRPYCFCQKVFENEFVIFLSADFIELTTLEKYGNQLALERDDIFIDFQKFLILTMKQRLQISLKNTRQENPSVEFQQSLSHIALEQPSIDQPKQIKYKEFVSLNELTQSKIQRANIKVTSFQAIQNEIVLNNEPECLQIENTANRIFSISTFYSPINNTMGEQQYILQNTARTTDKEIAYQINSKNNLVSTQTIQKHLVLRQKQNSIEDTDSQFEQSQSQKEEKQNKSSLLESLKPNFIIIEISTLKFTISFDVHKFILQMTLLIFILAVFIDLRTSFQINTKNFYYLSWGNNLRAVRSKCLKSYYVQMILSNPIYGYSNNPDLSLFQNEIFSDAIQSYNQYQQFIIQLTHEKTGN